MVLQLYQMITCATSSRWIDATRKVLVWSLVIMKIVCDRWRWCCIRWRDLTPHFREVLMTSRRQLKWLFVLAFNRWCIWWGALFLTLSTRFDAFSTIVDINFCHDIQLIALQRILCQTKTFSSFSRSFDAVPKITDMNYGWMKMTPNRWYCSWCCIRWELSFTFLTGDALLKIAYVNFSSAEYNIQ